MADQEKKEKVRPSFYATDELLREIEAQAKVDKENKSSLLEKLVGQLLESSNGKRMREEAALNERALAMELGLLLAAIYGGLPLSEIRQLAQDSQRDTYQMVVFLARQGLNTYKKQLEAEKKE